MIYTKIPFKKDARDWIAINWNALGAWDDKMCISEDEVTNAFGLGNLEEEVINKRNNTLSFLRLSNEIISIVRGREKRNIAVPPNDYV